MVGGDWLGNIYKPNKTIQMSSTFNNNIQIPTLQMCLFFRGCFLGCHQAGNGLSMPVWLLQVHSRINMTIPPVLISSDGGDCHSHGPPPSSDCSNSVRLSSTVNLSPFLLTDIAHKKYWKKRYNHTRFLHASTLAWGRFRSEL